MSGGPAVLRQSSPKSNEEIMTALRKNFVLAQKAASKASPQTVTWRDWCDVEDDRILMPSKKYAQAALSEDQKAYDITAKLFFLPSSDRSRWPTHALDALRCIYNELKIEAVNLLIFSFPDLNFQNEESSTADDSDAQSATRATRAVNTSEHESALEEDLDSIIAQWTLLEELRTEGKADELGVSDLGADQLAALVRGSKLKPWVDQVAVSDACNVPEKLTSIAKEAGVELLTHNDCADVLSRGTVRRLLGPTDGGPGILSDSAASGLYDELEPQWVIKYTAVVKDRGVIESKGYFAMAEVN